MKTADQVKPNYAPVYAAAMYPGLAQIFVKHGYALAVHGSLARDFDLIAIPWTEKVSDHQTVLADVKSQFAVDFLPSTEDGIFVFKHREHGRIAITLSVGFGECAIDLSFFPGK